MKIRGLNSQSTPQITQPRSKDKQAVWTAKVVLSVSLYSLKMLLKKERERESFSFLYHFGNLFRNCKPGQVPFPSPGQCKKSQHKPHLSPGQRRIHKSEQTYNTTFSTLLKTISQVLFPGTVAQVIFKGYVKLQDKKLQHRTAIANPKNGF